MGEAKKSGTTGVMKATITIDVLFPAYDADRFHALSLEDILHEADQEGWIAGAPQKGSPAEIADRETVVAELEAIANDGTFFDDVMDDAADEADEENPEEGPRP